MYAFKGDCFKDQLVIAVTRDPDDVRQLLEQADNILMTVWRLYMDEVRKSRKDDALVAADPRSTRAIDASAD
jgi:hypothetical protein